MSKMKKEGGVVLDGGQTPNLPIVYLTPRSILKDKQTGIYSIYHDMPLNNKLRLYGALRMQYCRSWLQHSFSGSPFSVNVYNLCLGHVLAV